MHYVSEHNIFLFLVQIAVLLGLARLLGEVFRRFGQPSITAEILVGLLLGPTLLGRTFPGFQSMLFPSDATQQNMLETVAWLGILFFLLKSGLETNFATAWRQRRQALTLSVSDLILPMLIAFLPCLLLPDAYRGEGGSRVVFALFISTIMTISALPVTARIMQDLKIYRTDLGLLIMSALTINDVAGWVIFAMILGLFTDAGMSIWSVAFILLVTILFTTFCLTAGSRLFNHALGRLRQWNVPEPAGSLTLVCMAGLIGGAVTTWIGIHALFGFFIAGIMAGESSRLSERTRHIFSQMVESILVPLFFASIGLKLDFITHFNLLLIVSITVIGIAGRYIGAYAGARLIGQLPLHSRLIANAHTPGGEMQIVIGMLALQYDIITKPVYVAIVFGALVSSVMAGPLMSRLLNRIRKEDWLVYLPVDHILPMLAARNRDEAIGQMCEIAARVIENQPASSIQEAVRKRETEMSTALDNSVAVPHARLAGTERPVVIFARLAKGIDWNAQDGLPVEHVFLVLTPEADASSQLQILRGIASTVGKSEVRQQIARQTDAAGILEMLRTAATPHPGTAA
jgi:Kef-type K+ transport system membrane component KefB/mannitol/fructose-specific phosphotransferase system IIA component (Ntr-type)